MTLSLGVVIVIVVVVLGEVGFGWTVGYCLWWGLVSGVG